MLDLILEAYSEVKPANIPERMFETTVDLQTRLTSYVINVNAINPKQLAGIAKQLINEQFSKNSFDLVIDCYGAIQKGNVKFDFYLRDNGLSYSPIVENSKTRFKIRGILVDSELKLLGEPLSRVLRNIWTAENPYVYFVIDKHEMTTANDLEGLVDKDIFPAIPIPETFLRALCIKERIPVDGIKRFTSERYPDLALFRTTLPGNHSHLYLASLAEGKGIEDVLYKDTVYNVQTEKVTLNYSKVSIGISGVFYTLQDATAFELNSLVEDVFYSSN